MDGYYRIEVKWVGGFKHNIYCRGYQLKSMMNFQKTIYWIESAEYKEITEQQFNKAQAYDDSDTTKEKSTGSRTKAGTNNRERNHPRGSELDKGVEARNSTSSGTTSRTRKSR